MTTPVDEVLRLRVKRDLEDFLAKTKGEVPLPLAREARDAAETADYQRLDAVLARIDRCMKVT